MSERNSKITQLKEIYKWDIQTLTINLINHKPMNYV
jgi:hypothetical protein